MCGLGDFLFWEVMGREMSVGKGVRVFVGGWGKRGMVCWNLKMNVKLAYRIDRRSNHWMFMYFQY